MDIKNIKGVIFDMDGVILDSMVIWNELAPRFLESKGVDPEADLMEVVFSMSMEQGVEYMKKRYGLKESTDELMQALQDFMRDFYYYEVEVKPGSKELMEALRNEGIRITAATSSPRDHVEHALERNGLLGYVEKLYTSGEVGSSKHSPEIYDLAAAYMGTRPDETLVFEDSLYALVTASTAGYHTAGVYDRLGEPDQEGLKAEAEVYITSPADFLRYLQ